MASHETRDVNARVIFGVAAGMVATALAMHAGISAYQRYLAHELKTASGYDAPATPPPEPRLQVSPAEDLAKYQEAELLRLGAWQWESEERAYAHVPIERAIDQLAKEGKAP